MLAGVYIKNFKCYQGTQFIPAHSLQSGKLVGYLGDNGAGKSAILEALSAYFSKKPHWIRNKEAKKGSSECFVAPVFVLEKKSLKLDAPSAFKDLYKNAELGDIPDGMVAICVAKREDGAITIFDGKKEITEEKNAKIARDLYEIIIKLHQYIYIDAEVDIDEAVRINSEIYEVLMGSSTISEVEDKIRESDAKGELINNLNRILEDMVDNKVTRRLKEIDSNYSYEGTGRGARAQLTPNVLARASAGAFLDARTLTYKGKQLDALSSGQRRVALIDFVISVLENKVFDPQKELIVAIDEPEISLDASKKMEQFGKIVGIAQKGVSVLFTSHWYGWIASTNLGRSVLIEERDSSRRDIAKFENKDFPFRDVPKYEMRMVFDFLSSLGASAETSKSTRYIICEGESDLHYLTASLESGLYKVIPVQKKNVKKMANIFKDYYWKDSGVTIKNVLFLIDTDPEQRETYDNLYLRRWSKTDDFEISLVSNNDNAHNKCTIEDVLEPKNLLKALKSTYPKESLIQGLKITFAELHGSDSFGMNAVDMRSFKKITKASKVELAMAYQKTLTTKKKTLLKELIENSFSS